MTRTIALVTEYDGTRFLGWQSQRDGRTVQGTLEGALSGLFEQPVTLYGCSRTDSGVHATGHVSHFRAAGTIPADRIPYALNPSLPDDVAIRLATEVPEDFHARYGARAKRYSYRIWNTRPRPVLHRRMMSHEPRPLDLDAMRAAAAYMTGTRDFISFMAAGGSTARTVRNMMEIRIERISEEPAITITVTGDGFLYNMVRILSGTLLYAGLGKIRPDEVPDILLSLDRLQAGKTMPAQGLTLDAVFYELDGHITTLSGEKLDLDLYSGTARKGGNDNAT